ncbi:MAG TPA: DUF6049 family protein [Acidimicrobiales bacterium]|nr:DUF6049 family protein [Acidimicrobiales bacterium]
MGRLGVRTVACVGVALALVAGPGAPGAWGGGASSGSPTLTLLSQTPWVGPGQAMELHLGLGTAAHSSLTLGLTLYAPLTSRSAFAQTVNGAGLGRVLSASGAIAVAGLSADPGGGVDLTVPVAGGDAPSTGTGPFAADLNCQPGACGGVYPLHLELTSNSGARAQLTTYLVYADPPATTQKLRLAWVVPLGSAPSSSDAPGALTPGAVGLGAVADVLSALEARPTVAVTLAPEPATMAALADSSRPRWRSAVAGLGALGAVAGHQILAQSYVPVDATALVSAGLGGELSDQIHRAAQVLAPWRAVPGASTWVSTDGVDQASVAALRGLGFTHLVLPPSAVTQGGPAPIFTPTEPFALSAGRGVSIQTAESDPGLGAHLSAASGPGAALAAYQLLADLALVYYEHPNLDTPRAVMAVGPPTWAPAPVFLDTVLSALESDPLVVPVSLDTLFASVPSATGVTHRPAATNSSSTLPARQLRSARARLSAFADAVEGQSAVGVIRGLDERLLATEDERLRPAQQVEALGAFGNSLDAQLAALSIRSDTVRLTSTAAKVPITVVKQAPYSVTGVLRITGSKVVFPSGAAQVPGSVCRSPSVQVTAERSVFSCTATIGHTTNAVYVDMRARATGDFRLTVTLTSPSGRLVLAESHLTVRSMSTSAVALALSLAAMAVLLVWWGRTLWRGRRSGRRGAHVRARRPVAAR